MNFNKVLGIVNLAESSRIKIKENLHRRSDLSTRHGDLNLLN